MYDRMPGSTCKFRSIFTYLLVVAIWFTGCVLGLILFDTVRAEYVSLMRSSFSSSVSIVGGLTVVFLPLLFTALAIYISKPGFVYFILFAKSFLFTLATVACYAAFHADGWLVQVLLLFSDSFGTLLLQVTVFRLVCGDGLRWRSAILGNMIAGVLILAFDHFWILPIVGRI